MENILVIGGKDFMMKCMVDLGLKFTLVQFPGQVTPFQKEHANFIVERDYPNTSPTEILALLPKTSRFEVVVSFTEYGLSCAADIASELGVPSNCDIEAIAMTKDKLAFRKILEKYHINNVPFTPIYSEADIAHFLKQHGKIIVKPSQGAGSFGIHLVTSESEAKKAFEHAIQAKMGNIMAEAFIEGPEYSIESISKNGQHEVVAITEKATTGAPYFVESGHSQPAELCVDIEKKITEFTIELLNIIEHKTGPCHTEVKIYENQIYIIETQTRSGGDNIWLMTHLTSGTDLFKETVTTLLNLPCQIREPVSNAAAVKYFMPDTAVSAGIESRIDKIGNINDVVDLHINLELFNACHSSSSSLDRAGYVVTSAETRSAALTLADNVVNTIVKGQ